MKTLYALAELLTILSPGRWGVLSTVGALLYVLWIILNKIAIIQSQFQSDAFDEKKGCRGGGRLNTLHHC